ncbi:baseplate J/gp47 family protein [Mailhella massiliensis]|uniref:Baseplate J/gp47 family protein n=1 Tax=Mailhella massiliensis TaxID=1903261 RepID=A0A921DSY1_9BACT|nr:baseplate J/gp47 family protein [Mailhella massiliensis]HJD97487.1 baseplate J/gp47 family protein [Mailhella massiliensis]
MSFSRPSLSTLRSRIAADVSGRLLDGAPLRSRSVLSVLVYVWAGACHLMYGALQWYFSQFWIKTAEKEYLERKASTWGITRKAGARAVGTVTFSGSGLVPAGSVLRSDSGLLFTVDADVSVPGIGNVTASAIGSSGNLEAGETLTLVQAVAGVSGSAVVNSLSGGVDAETDEELRARLLTALQAPPMGGSAADYVTWALEVPGVTRAWCYPLYLGLGTVGLSFVCDGQEESPLPDEEMVQRVQDYIDARRPVTADFLAFAPQALKVDISLKISPNTEAVRNAVKQELADLFVREGTPGVTIPLSHINEAVSISAGEEDHVLVSPTENIVPENNVMPMLGNVTFAGVD